MPEQKLPHLLVSGFTWEAPYQSPNNGGGRRPSIPRPRVAHGTKLIRQLRRLVRELPDIVAVRQEYGLPERAGIAVALEIKPKGALDFKGLEWKNDGFEVLSAIEHPDSEIVVLHVPDGHIGALEKRIQAYLEKNAKSGKPQNLALVNAIENIRRAAFDDFWTDEDSPPEDLDERWFQVWLRADGRRGKVVRDAFEELGERLGLEVERGFVTFPGRVVVAVRATRQSIQQAVELLDMVAEIRGVADTAEFFLSELKPYEQNEWVDSLVERSVYVQGSRRNRITLLDTGVNNGHPLLAAGLAEEDMHTYDPTWGAADHDGHGSEMAGLLLYGNLTSPLANNERVHLTHRLESVKILPPDGENPPRIYGAITAESAYRVEATAPRVRRVFAMMTTSRGGINGEPSEWSATIDQLAYGLPALEIGVDDQDDRGEATPRLYVLAAGNVAWPDWASYPAINALAPAENPSQAWNALAVGASTNLTEIDATEYPGQSVIARRGALAPASRTAILWKKEWPHKPDVVAEGGNGSLDTAANVTVGPESLRMLTTSNNIPRTLLAETGDTSAATAEVARLCGQLSHKYPDFWPETIRALVVHGARYTRAMRSSLRVQPTMQDKYNLLRTYGFGLIQPNISAFSEAYRSTVVLQETITPYREVNGSAKLGQMLLHELPWPDEELQDLAETEVSLRVTLSYFVEPNPSRRGWQSKFRYGSFGLRFALKGATETDQEFVERVNALERDDDDERAHGDPDLQGWTFGPKLRTKGSIHLDVWTGTAAELASKGQIAVFPVGGWWKDWKEAGQWDTEVRYALVLSLEVGEQLDADLYTPIKTKIDAATVAQQVEVDDGSEE
ncbi:MULTISPECIES: S8 family peptidase [Ralstonia]|uniref:S8 family peptidase n=1 Tax=Ralstonia TaxID=48736 RepID=UPI0011BE6BF8|nr:MULTISPECIES: S8 family peptidase [Ralstonia]MCT7306223.1 S8 family peptidase [Ralstonia wenshanensis]TXD63264.1 S8 family serine peptidase [Ralstonia sp. TCR112]